MVRSNVKARASKMKTQVQEHVPSLSASDTWHGESFGGPSQQESVTESLETTYARTLAWRIGMEAWKALAATKRAKKKERRNMVSKQGLIVKKVLWSWLLAVGLIFMKEFLRERKKLLTRRSFWWMGDMNRVCPQAGAHVRHLNWERRILLNMIYRKEKTTTR